MKKSIIYITVVFAIAGVFFMPRVARGLKWRLAAEAVGGFPYQIGLTGVTVTPCVSNVTNCSTPLCAAKDPSTACSGYLSYVTGAMAGGDGTEAVFTNTQISQAGLTSGGQLIAGGMSSVAMDSGVLASTGGCAGCTARLDGKKLFAYKILDWLDDFSIAGKKSFK